MAATGAFNSCDTAETKLSFMAARRRCFTKARQAAAEKYSRLAGTGKTSDDIRQIVPAACDGSIESIFVDVQAQQWGRYDPQTVTVELHETPQNGDDDMLDFAVVQTLLNRGVVYAVPQELVPGTDHVAAVFRY